MQLCYDSNISPTYRGCPVGTPDIQLRAIDATLCIIGHLAPNLGEYPDVFLFCYNSNISLISCRRPTLCNGHGVLHYWTTRAQLGRAVQWFPFLLQFKYFSDILWTSDSAQWPRHFCIIGQLTPNSAERSNGFPFCYNSNISLIYCGHPVGLWMSDSAQWPRHFCIIGQLTPNLAKCSDAFPFITFHLSFFQIYFHCCLAYPISDISRGTCI